MNDKDMFDFDIKTPEEWKIKAIKEPGKINRELAPWVTSLNSVLIFVISVLVVVFLIFISLKEKENDYINTPAVTNTPGITSSSPVTNTPGITSGLPVTNTPAVTDPHIINTPAPGENKFPVYKNKKIDMDRKAEEISILLGETIINKEEDLDLKEIGYDTQNGYTIYVGWYGNFDIGFPFDRKDYSGESELSKEEQRNKIKQHFDNYKHLFNFEKPVLDIKTDPFFFDDQYGYVYDEADTNKDYKKSGQITINDYTGNILWITNDTLEYEIYGYYEIITEEEAVLRLKNNQGFSAVTSITNYKDYEIEDIEFIYKSLPRESFLQPAYEIVVRIKDEDYPYPESPYIYFLVQGIKDSTEIPFHEETYQ